MEFGTGFFGFEVGEIYIFFSFSDFKAYFLNFRPQFRYLYPVNLFFSLEIIIFVRYFISAQNYRIAPSTADGRVYFHFQGHRTFELGFFR